MEKSIFTVLSSWIRRLPNGGARARNAGMRKSKAGQGGPGKAFIVAYVGPEKSHREFGLELDSVRVSRQCPFNKCSRQNGHGFYTKSKRHAPEEGDFKPEMLSSGVSLG